MDISTISQLSYQEINSLQENLSSIVKSRISQFFYSIERNDIQEINSFVSWGIPKENSQFDNFFNHLVFKSHIQLETINTLYESFQNNKYLQDNIIMKVIFLLSKGFDTASKKNVFNTFDFYFSDLLVWLKEKDSNAFDIHFRKVINSNWGAISFDFERHQSLEKYYLKNSTKHTNAVLKASRKSNYATMEHFCSPLYLKDLYTLTQEEQSSFWTSCLEKAIQNSNIETIQFLFDKGIELPISINCYSHFIQQSHIQPNFQTTLNLLIEKAGTPSFNDNVFLRSALNSNHVINTKFLLETYYKDSRYIESIADFSHYKNQKSSESLLYLKQFYTYWSLSLKLEEKDTHTSKMKI